jgi:hypothetical protein
MGLFDQTTNPDGTPINYNYPPPPPIPMPTPAATPGSQGYSLSSNPIMSAYTQAMNNFGTANKNILSKVKGYNPPNMAPFSAAAGDGAVPQPLGPAAAQTASPMDPYQSGGHMPWPPSPRAQVPPGAPQAAQPPATQSAPYSPWDPQGAGLAAAQRLQNPWDPQGAGWQAAQRLAAQQGPPQGALANPAMGQQPNSPFTMVMRPNAPANNASARGGGGTPLGTALDLSGYQPPPPAPPSYNLGYGGGGRVPAPIAAPRPYRAQGPGPTNFAGLGPYHDPIGSRVPIGQPVLGSTGGSGVVQGRNGMEMLNPGRAFWGGGPAQ